MFRVLGYVFTRPRVLFFGGLGALFWLYFGWPIAGGVCLGLTAAMVLRIATRPNLATKLRLRAERRRHGVKRGLSSTEKAEVVALDAYGRALRDAGVSSELTREPLTQGWRLIREAGLNDATEKLRAFRVSLPSLESETSGGAQGQLNTEKFQDRLRREVALINAAEREIQKLQSP